jgi:hypothetical protein
MRQGPEADEPGAAFISPRMAKAMASPLRSRIMVELNNGPVSPSQFVERVFPGLAAATRRDKLSEVARAFRQLAAWGFVEIADERTGGRRRGGTEKVYRAVERAHFDPATWKRLPRFLRTHYSSNIARAFLGRVVEAFEGDSLDAEVDRHLSCSGVTLDRTAWTELTTALDSTLDWLPQLEAEAALRLRSSGEDPIPTTVGLAAFRSPTDRPPGSDRN